MKIAIIGSGISGLTCAYQLSKHHEIEVFEANDYIGGHTRTVKVKSETGEVAVDTGFIVFNDWTYPNFIKMMNEVKVSSKESSMSFSVKSEVNNIEYNGTNLNSLFAQRINFFRPSFYRMIKDILRFNKNAPLVLENDSNDSSLTLKEYLEKYNYSKEFKQNYIIPMGAAIWSSSAEQMDEFPIEFFVRFFKNHGMLSVDDRPVWRVIEGGSSAYIPKLTESFKDKIHLNTPVLSVNRQMDGVEVVVLRNQENVTLKFDEVIFACHADQTNKILKSKTTEEETFIQSFEYQKNHTILHTDSKILPKRKLAWAAWNYFLPKNKKNKVAVSYWMNCLQGFQSKEDFIVSLNMEEDIDSSKVKRTFIYEHPVYNKHSFLAQKKWSEISGKNKIHFCGAYLGYGFHEDGVKSGLKVCEMILKRSLVLS